MAKVTPDNWSPFIQIALTNVNNILTMGLVEQDYTSPIAKSGKFFTRPYQQDITNATAPVDYDATTTITPGDVDDLSEIMVVVHKGQGFKETEYDRTTRGQNGLDSLMQQRSELILRTIQTSLVNVVNGVFASNGPLASTNIYDGTSVGTGIFSVNMLNDGCEEIFGEDAENFDAYIMHSKTYNKLKTDGYIDFKVATEFANMTLRTGTIPTINGKKILINNALCANEGTTADPIYPVYAMKGSPLYLAWQRNVRIYTDFDPAVGGGTNKNYWYADYVPAVKGVSWTKGTYDPANSDLATGTNWTKILPTKLIPIVKIKSLYVAAS